MSPGAGTDRSCRYASGPLRLTSQNGYWDGGMLTGSGTYLSLSSWYCDFTRSRMRSSCTVRHL
jgi:hypothetical protein